MENTTETTSCPHCGKEFARTNKRHTYCSPRCREAARIARLELHEGVCKGCGKPMTFKLKAGKPSRQYCSRSCQLEHTTPVKVVQCVDCGKQIEFKGRTRKLRCGECNRKWKSKCVMIYRARKDSTVQVGVGSGRGQGQNTEYTEERKRASEARKVYYQCNKESLRAASRNRYRLKSLRMHTGCALCGYSGSIDALVVHHKDMNRLNNDESNLVVLCQNCHTILHKVIRQRQRTAQVSAADVYDSYREAKVKSRNEAGTPDTATRTEG